MQTRNIKNRTLPKLLHEKNLQQAVTVLSADKLTPLTLNEKMVTSNKLSVTHRSVATERQTNKRTFTETLRKVSTKTYPLLKAVNTK